MRFSSVKSSLALLTSYLLAISPSASAQGILQTNSLNTCAGSTNTGFTATLFDVIYTSNNNTITFNINAISSINQKVIAQIEVFAYGLVIVNQTFDPCTDASLSPLCPLAPGTINLNSNKELGNSVTGRVPSIAYNWPDIDGVVRAYISNRDTGAQLACVEAELSNGKTVDQTGVKWATAIVSGLALLVSAVVSGLGHSNTAAHIASNALSLFGFFQSQALIGMTSVAMPPMVESWTQNFQWTMGVVGINFMQHVCTWYQRATGGTPSTILSNLANVSVEVQKRGLQLMNRLAKRGLGLGVLAARQSSPTTSSQQTIVTGIERVGFKAGIEPTNIFLTGLGIFVAFVVAVAICVTAFKGFVELGSRQGWIKGDKFSEFRSGWRVVLKGILFRIVLIGYSQMTVLCLWELTMRDSAAEVVVAIFYFVAMSAALVWAALKVIRIAKRSVSLHKNPAYILYSDPTALNKWGFLYVQYRATAYYFILPQLAYILFKSVFVAFAQGSPVVQAVGFLVIEAAWLIGVSIVRPWMDKKTNGLNIAIAAMSFLSAVFLLIFTDVFNQPGIVTGVVGLVFFFFNAIFALILLIMLIVSSVFAILYKNPDTRYQPMRDDRGSFIKSQSNLNTELDALGATARGDMKMKRDLDDDSDSFMSGRASFSRQHHDAAGVPLPSSAAASSRNVNDYPQGPHSPIDPGAPFIPNNGAPRHGAPAGYNSLPPSRSNNGSPAPRFNQQGYSSQGYSNGAYGNGGYGGQPQYGYDGSGSTGPSNAGYRPYGGGGAGNSSGGNQWQRGAGYDH